jgi:hypothetical protein
MAAAIVALCRAPEAQWRRASDAAHARAHGYSWDDATTRLLAALADGGAC